MGKNVLFWVSVAFGLMFLFNMLQGPASPLTSGANEKITYSDFMDAAQAGSIANVIIKGEMLHGVYANGGGFYTRIPQGDNVVARLENTGVQIAAEKVDPEPISLLSILSLYYPRS